MTSFLTTLSAAASGILRLNDDRATTTTAATHRVPFGMGEGTAAPPFSSVTQGGWSHRRRVITSPLYAAPTLCPGSLFQFHVLSRRDGGGGQHDDREGVSQATVYVTLDTGFMARENMSAGHLAWTATLGPKLQSLLRATSSYPQPPLDPPAPPCGGGRRGSVDASSSAKQKGPRRRLDDSVPSAATLIHASATASSSSSVHYDVQTVTASLPPFCLASLGVLRRGSYDGDGEHRCDMFNAMTSAACRPLPRDPTRPVATSAAEPNLGGGHDCPCTVHLLSQILTRCRQDR